MPRRVRAEAELGLLPLLPLGAVVELAVPGGGVWSYHAVGCTTPPIALRLGWGAQNVWLRDVERQFMLAKRPVVFVDLAQPIAHIL